MTSGSPNSPLQIGNYYLENQLGQGGTSQVFRARHRHLKDREVAIKLLQHQDPDGINRFRVEAELTAKLRHPNIVEVYDHGQTGNYYYTVLELVRGDSLRQYLHDHTRIAPAQAFDIFRQIGAALDFAHSQNIIHRDVSSGNILLEQATKRALLTDFGIARVPQNSHTTTHVIMGTPGFFSPEHAQSATAVTPLSDLFSLGVILYTMLTGQSPWPELPTHPEYHFGTVLPLSMRGVDLPPDVDRVLQTLLALDPKKRYPSAKLAAEALDRALARSGIVLERTAAPAPGGATTVRAINIAPSFQATGVLSNDVEQALGLDLVRQPIEKAHERAQSLCDPVFVAQLLDEWSRNGRWQEFRRPHFGRVINLRTVASRNVFFYEVRVLLETRLPPQPVEEPDDGKDVREAKNGKEKFKPQREQERWAIKLAVPTAFADDPGKTEVIPGSERVISCDRCGGDGQIMCPECKGSRRILKTVVGGLNAANDSDTVQRFQPAADAPPVATAQPVMGEARQVLVPCPVCAGAGQLPCERCETHGRLVQRKVFRWHRTSHQHTAHDDLPNLDEVAIQRVALPVLVYDERAIALKSEWEEVKGLKPLLAQIEAGIGPDTRVALAEVRVSLIPLTTIEFDQGHNTEVSADDAAAPADDRSYTVQVYGFENHLKLPPIAFDNERRVLVWACCVAVLVAVLSMAYALVLA